MFCGLMMVLVPKVAEAIAALRLPDVRAMACHQLTPELAEPISQARAVVFVDAAAGAEPAEVTVRPVQAVQAGRIAAHRSSPEALLALAEGLYGRAPRAWLVAVPAFALGFGEELSPQTLRHFQEAIRVIKRLRR